MIFWYVSMTLNPNPGMCEDCIYDLVWWK